MVKFTRYLTLPSSTIMNSRSIDNYRSIFALCSFSLFLCSLLFWSIALPQSAAAQSRVVCTTQEEATSSSPLLINEILASNDDTVIDPADGKSDEDWIEIYNPSSQQIDLQGLYLSDRLGELTKHQITQTLVISPFGYLLIFVDDDPEQGPNHLSFQLSASGEAIALTESDGLTIIDSCIFTEQQENIPIGRLPDGQTWAFLSTATPGASNAFVPVISNVLNSPEIPSALEPVTVSAIVTDDVSVDGVTLFYSSTNIITLAESNVISISMSTQGDDLYEAQIPGLPNDSLVSYYIEAQDEISGTMRSPVNAPASTHKFLVGYEAPQIAINELMSTNSMSLIDPDEPITATVGNLYPDWFEIYNYGSTFVDLNGLYLTDDRYQPTKNPITDTILIAPGDTFIFYADEDRRQGSNHVNFRLSSLGETLAIFGPYGASPIDIVDFGPLSADRVLGRFPDGTGGFDQALCSTPDEGNLLCDLTTFVPFLLTIDRFR